MNKFYALIVVLLIFGLPLGSYMYLQKGYDFRKAALDEIATAIPLSEVVGENDLKFLKDTLENRVSIVLSKELSQHTQEEISKKLNEQFGMNKQFQIFSTDDLRFEALLKSGDLAIYDVESKLRKTYQNDPEELKSLVTHISILLPMPIEKDVILKRDLNQNG